MEKITQEELNEILEKHEKWLRRCPDGKRAVLAYKDCSSLNFTNANLKESFLKGSNFTNADFSGANLTDAWLVKTNLTGACFEEANLTNACLFKANLTQTNFTLANLVYANLTHTRLAKTYFTNATLTDTNFANAVFQDTEIKFPMICPSDGDFIGWKKCCGKIVKLKIPADAKRLSGTGRKCRASKAEVLAIEWRDGTPSSENKIASNYDHSFIYTVGKVVEVDNFDEDRWNECSSGIHFFITREEAVDY